MACRVPVDFYVDVSRVFDTKRRMLACHASQRNWLLRQHGIDEYLESQAQMGRGPRGRDRRGAGRGVPPVSGASLSAGQPAAVGHRAGWTGERST